MSGERNLKDLPAFRITTTSGHSWVTSMAPGTTLEAAQAYFIGEFFHVRGNSDKNGVLECAVKVEELP